MTESKLNAPKMGWAIATRRTIDNEGGWNDGKCRILSNSYAETKEEAWKKADIAPEHKKYYKAIKTEI